MNVLDQDFVLSNGITIPKLGFGTWQIPNDQVVNAVRLALKHGYRHIDTASAYQNEEGVGHAIRESGIERNGIFITTKVPAECKSYAEAKAIISQSLKNLNLGYIDLLLIHSPKPWSELFSGSNKTYFEENAAVWKAMEEAYADGIVKAIGVSNFEIQDIENINKRCTVTTMVNQIKYHIGYTQNDLVAFCQSNGILVEAYSPIATGKLLKNNDIAAIAKKYEKSLPQLCIRYVFQKGTLPLPKSTHEEYIIQDSQIDFEISPSDMGYLDDLSDIT